VLTLGNVLKSQCVKWFTDNQGVKAIVLKGSMRQKLQEIAYAIFQYCMKNAISVEVEWVHRTQNEKADFYRACLFLMTGDFHLI
jgi:hypothetical protein